MWLQRADFDASGAFLTKVNLTAPDEGVGYIVLHPDASAVLFSTELPNGDVETYQLNLTTPGAKPVEFLRDIAGLLPPCKGNPVPCVDASTFQTTWSTSGSMVSFAYRVWDNEGEGARFDGGGGGGGSDCSAATPRHIPHTHVASALALLHHATPPLQASATRPSALRTRTAPT